MGYLFTPKEMKLFLLTALLISLLHFTPSYMWCGSHRYSRCPCSDHSRRGGVKKKKDKNPLKTEIKTLRITWTVAKTSCFPLCLHNWVSFFFYAEVLMQLACPLPQTCARSRSGFKESKKFYLPSISGDLGLIWHPLLSRLLKNKKQNVVCCSLNSNNGSQETATRASATAEYQR